MKIEKDGHRWTRVGLWWCDNHRQECDPIRPVAVDDLLKLAARDATVSDDVFPILSRALRGVDPIEGGD